MPGEITNLHLQLRATLLRMGYGPKSDVRTKTGLVIVQASAYPNSAGAGKMFLAYIDLARKNTIQTSNSF